MSFLCSVLCLRDTTKTIYTQLESDACTRPQYISIGFACASRSLEVVRRRVRCRRRRSVRSRGSRRVVRGRARTPRWSSQEVGARNHAPPPPSRAAPGASPRAASGGRVPVCLRAHARHRRIDGVRRREFDAGQSPAAVPLLAITTTQRSCNFEKRENTILIGVVQTVVSSAH